MPQVDLDNNPTVCDLSYIPNRLHINGRIPENTFAMFEKLFRRCNENTREFPFATISLRDLSHNRSGKDVNNPLSLPDDVLYNIDKTKNFERYDSTFCVLVIKELTENNQYHKIFSDNTDSGDTLEVFMKLVHKPEVCNYAHVVFSIFISPDLEVTMENYDTTLNRRPYKRIRDKIRQELHTMILREEVRINFQ